MTQGNILVVTAPSGAGKTTLVAALLAADANVQLSISFTSRAPRAGEVDGKDYRFVDRATFEAMIAAGELLEYAEVYGNYYGTSKAWINEARQSGRDILLEIDTQGAAQVRELFPDAIGLFVLPPSLDVLEQRLKNRGKDADDVIARRMAEARAEIGHAGEFDYLIVNEYIDEAVRDIVSIVRAERLREPLQTERHAQLLASLKG
ncbi:guanylate kinase [Jeongeupia naejangsanensis]|uniref:Guanylate kinase n=1 Tax=Jeongeupia naejangsanensis TaxID=613195 RepID=A0ABS2BPF8_9NEIS|nr:guanylate kinase [Jeongeupia naejangsanensis]MBM3117305.1 guanylate kinase [Jeongeupia naejangsanensis]